MLPHLTFRLLGLTLPAMLALALATGAASAATELPAGELRALKYYVEQGDRKAALAEVARLKALHPDWTPPADLSRVGAVDASAAQGPGDDANRIWRLIEIGNLAAARGRLEHLKTVYPDWTPPDEMMDLLETAEAQLALDRAAATGDAEAAIAAVRKTPEILRCDRVNNAWTLALMQRKLGNSQAALQTYRGVLGSCTDTGVLVATLQKAHEIATPDQTRELAAFTKSRRPAAMRSIDIALKNLKGGKPSKSDKPAKTTKTATAERGRSTEAVRTTRAADAPATAPATPRLSAPRQGNLPTSGDGRVASVRAAARSGAWAQCLARSTEPRSVDVLYERAWCAYNQNRSLEALAAFRVASTSALGAVVQRDARFGMILSFLANQMTEDAARMAAVTDLTSEQRLDVETVILDQRGVRAFQREEYRDSIAYLDALERLTGGIRRDLAIMRAYAYLNAGERVTAHRLFTDLHDQLATPETRKGLNASRG